MFALGWNPRLVVTGLALVALCGCGDGGASDYEIVPEPSAEVVAPSETDRTEPEAAPEPEAGPGPAPSPGSDPNHERSLLAELLATVGDEDERYGFDPNAAGPRTLADAIDGCVGSNSSDDPFGFVCTVQFTGALDSQGRFIVLVPESELSGHTRANVVRDDGNSRRTLLSFEAFGAPLPALRRRLRRYGRLAIAPNLITARAYLSFASIPYPALVALAAPLEGWVLWYETTGLEDREERLHLMRADGSDDRILATQEAPVGPCDGGGYWCEINNTDHDAECTNAMLEAEGRLCVLPTEIAHVAVAPNGLLLVMGNLLTAVHDDAPLPTHWTVMLPDDLRP